jgi:hypothetical protein
MFDVTQTVSQPKRSQQSSIDPLLSCLLTVFKWHDADITMQAAIAGLPL